MIVGSAFDGDNDRAIQLRQHEAYSEAIAIVSQGCLEHYKNAAIMRGEYDAKLADQITLLRSEGFDHRTLQAAHDYLAAWWRWEYKRRDPYFEGLELVTLADWLLWLRQEVDSWSTQAPQVVQLIARVLLNQNVAVGYDAEDKLLQELKGRYAGMPEKDNQSTVQVQESIEGDDPHFDWDAYFRTEIARKAAERSAQYARHTVVGKVKMYISELLEDEKKAWREYTWPEKHQVASFFKNLGIWIVALSATILVFGCISGVFIVLGWNQYMPESDEEGIGGLTSMVIFIASILFVLSTYVSISDIYEGHRKNKEEFFKGAVFAYWLCFIIRIWLHTIRGIKDIFSEDASKGCRPYWLGFIGLIFLAVVSAIIDTLSGNYLFSERGSILLQILLGGAYAVSAFLIFCLWAMIARFGPFSK